MADLELFCWGCRILIEYILNSLKKIIRIRKWCDGSFAWMLQLKYKNEGVRESNTCPRAYNKYSLWFKRWFTWSNQWQISLETCRWFMVVAVVMRPPNFLEGVCERTVAVVRQPPNFLGACVRFSHTKYIVLDEKMSYFRKVIE